MASSLNSLPVYSFMIHMYEIIISLNSVLKIFVAINSIKRKYLSNISITYPTEPSKLISNNF